MDERRAQRLEYASPGIERSGLPTTKWVQMIACLLMTAALFALLTIVAGVIAGLSHF
jgi:hypothetical protein